MDEMYTTRDISRRLNTKHKEVIRRLELIIRRLKELDTGDNELAFLFSDFTYEKYIEEYRGNLFDAYRINKAMLLLVLGRMAGEEAFKLRISVICGSLELEGLVDKATLGDRLFLVTSMLREDSRHLEKEYQKRVLKNCESIFPKYSFVGREVETLDGDRIDFLGCDASGRDVIIETKITPVSAHKQLRSYAYGYSNPILVNLTPKKPRNIAEGIRYVVWPTSKTLTD